MSECRWGRFVPALLVFASLWGGSIAEVSAEPSVWASARRPNASARERLATEAQKGLSDSALQKERTEMYSGLPVGSELMEAARIEARAILEKAGGATSPNMLVRLQYASLMQTIASKQKPRNLENVKEAAKIIQAVIASRPDPAILEVAWGELGVCYAVLGERDKEIQAYGQALHFQPIGHRRATLMANRAESYMGAGRLDDAIQGYRDALAALLPDEMRTYGVTTLWGLAVALDRNGDMEAGLANIRLARIYDEIDEEINKEGWFYSPAHDEHWYKALGAWGRARAIENSIDKTFAYGHAIEAWERYIDRAPAGDLYVELAKIRRRACEIEREKAAKVKSKPIINLWDPKSPSTPFPLKP